MAPATIANLGPGFDIFGLAVTQPVDTVSISTNDSGTVTLDSDLGTDPERNAAGITVLKLREKFPMEKGLHIVVKKGMEIGTGMGSSAASGAAAAKAYQELYRLSIGAEVSLPDILEACVHSEGFCAGSRHGDNCLPSFLGGFVIITSVDPIPQYTRLEVPKGLQVVLVKPDIQVLTKTARDILPVSVSLRSRVNISSHCASMAAALATGDLVSFCRNIVNSDIEEARAPLIPNYSEAKTAALSAGALAFSISGSGPAVFALTTEAAGNAPHIASCVSQAFATRCKVFCTAPNNVGAQVIHSEVSY